MFHVLFPVVSYILRKVNSQSGGVTLVDLGTGTSFDVKTLAPNVDYTQLTSDNFIIELTNSESTGNSGTGGKTSVRGYSVKTKNYNSETGALSASIVACGYYTNWYTMCTPGIVTAYLVIR